MHVDFLAVGPRASGKAPTWRVPCTAADAMACFTGWHPAVPETVGAVEVDAAWWGRHDIEAFATWTSGRVVLLGPHLPPPAPRPHPRRPAPLPDPGTVVHVPDGPGVAARDAVPADVGWMHGHDVRVGGRWSAELTEAGRSV